jgi:hypothetical protein
MKLQLDTTRKILKIEEDVKLSKLISVVKRLLPNGEWQDFTLITNTVIEKWVNPIPYKPYWPDVYPWWQQPWYATNPIYIVSSTPLMNNSSCLKATGDVLVTVSNLSPNTNSIYELKDGVYNIEI